MSKKFNRLSIDEEKALLTTIQDDNETSFNRKQAKNKMIVYNMHIVDYAINRFYKGVTYDMKDDMRQEGAIGLNKAVDRFSLDHDVRFSTYAIWWIRQTINKSLSDTAKTIRTPVYVGEAIHKIAKASDEIFMTFGREATDAELEEAVGYSAKRIAEFRNSMLVPSTLDFDIGDDTQLSDMIEDENSIDPETAQILRDMSAKLADIMIRTLSPREEHIIRLRQGIGTVDSHTLEEIGSKLNLTKERIRQIEAGAMQKLKKSYEVKVFKRDMFST